MTLEVGFETCHLKTLYTGDDQGPDVNPYVQNDICLIFGFFIESPEITPLAKLLSPCR